MICRVHKIKNLEGVRVKRIRWHPPPVCTCGYLWAKLVKHKIEFYMYVTWIEKKIKRKV